MEDKSTELQEVLRVFDEDAKALEDKLEKNESTTNFFLVKSANKWIDEAKSRPIPKLLFDSLWFEGELCILFADTNVGKSILAVQIANSISKGKPIRGFKTETGSKKVAYLDFELSDKQFEKRYSNNYADHYVFNENFLRAEINAEVEIPKEFKNAEEYICFSFEEVIKKHKAEVLIIDNITYLKNDNERAKDALLLMKHLKALNKKYGVSILVLAHTPKRDETKPITKNDLAGSKMLMNFCDSAFAIGESASLTSGRYLKQIKQRNTEQVYHQDNVALFQIENPRNFLMFTFIGFSTEAEHLKQIKASDKQDRDNQILDMFKEGMSKIKIAAELGVTEGTVRYVLKKLEAK